METANNDQPFSQQFTRIDEPTFQDEWGEIYTSPVILMPSAEESVPYVAKELSQIVERIIRTRKGRDWIAPTLSTSEYFERIRAYRPVHCKNGRPEGCYISIAEDASENRLYSGTVLACMPDVDKIGQAYESTLIELADELIEYRTLKAVRPILNRNELIPRLQQKFLDNVNNSASVMKRDAISDLEAELSLCLTQVERVSQLTTEYQQRLALYKREADQSIIGQSSATFLTSLNWQIFTPTELQYNCNEFVHVQVLHNPDDVDFDLTLIHPFPVNEAEQETSDLAAQWLVLQWIKAQIQGIGGIEQSIPVQQSMDHASFSSDSPINQQNGTALTQAALALYYVYCHETDSLPRFLEGKKQEEYQKAVEGTGLSATSFRIKYNLFAKAGSGKKERMALNSRSALLGAIKLLKNHPLALAMAKDELKLAEVR